MSRVRQERSPGPTRSPLYLGRHTPHTASVGAASRLILSLLGRRKHETFNNTVIMKLNEGILQHLQMTVIINTLINCKILISSHMKTNMKK